MKKIDIKPIPGTEQWITLDMHGVHRRKVNKKKGLLERLGDYLATTKKVIVYQKYIHVTVLGRAYALLPPENATEDQIYQVAKELIDTAEDNERFLLIQKDWKLEAL